LYGYHDIMYGGCGEELRWFRISQLIHCLQIEASQVSEMFTHVTRFGGLCDVWIQI
jgi:hypothetical protein